MAANPSLTQAQIDALKEKARHFKDNGGSVTIPADQALIMLNAYIVPR